VNLQNFAGNTALHFAVASGKRDVAEALLQHGAKKKIQNNAEKSPFDYR
jgi:ankyrin repeat protein